jgi:hypothetical protein
MSEIKGVRRDQKIPTSKMIKIKNIFIRMCVDPVFTWDQKLMILAHMTLWVVEFKRFWIFEIFNHCVLTKKLVGWPSIIGPGAKQCT